MLPNLIIVALACANLYFAIVCRSVLNLAIAVFGFGYAFVGLFQIMAGCELCVVQM